MSTASSILLVGATTFARDFYQTFSKKQPDDKKLVFMSRAITIVISVASLGFAMMKLSTIFWLQPNMVATMGASVGTALVAGFAWKRASKQGAIASILSGIIVTTLWFAFKMQAVTGVHPVIPGTIASILAIVIVSLLTEAPPKEVISEFFPANSSLNKSEGIQSESV
jgi:Na+/proline symporter